jgi:DNA-directed RNA polymerase alpha subunit
MARQADDNLEHDFPAGLSKPALSALEAAGYTRLDQLAQATEADLLKLHGMGPKGIDMLRRALKARGKAFAG